MTVQLVSVAVPLFHMPPSYKLSLTLQLVSVAVPPVPHAAAGRSFR